MRVIDEKKLFDILDFIKEFQKKEGRSPSFRQITNALDLKSLSVAQRYVSILQSRGLLEKNNSGKIITPTNLSKGKTIIAPLVGKIACGTPIFAEENIEETFQLPTAIFGSEKVMLLHASGDSMIGAGIYDGDLVVATICNDAKDGDIVVALIDNEATLKRFYRKNGTVILHPENPKYEDIIPEELVIQGIVKHVIHSY
ncbi:MAG: transcriptional repressor LexA [Christensenellales bacterium]